VTFHRVAGSAPVAVSHAKKEKAELPDMVLCFLTNLRQLGHLHCEDPELSVLSSRRVWLYRVLPEKSTVLTQKRRDLVNASFAPVSVTGNNFML
jgi:hypothetical protein